MAGDKPENPKIVVVKNGPFMVHGVDDMVDHRDRPLETKQVMALCRCGASSNKPFCDGNHAKEGFTGEKQAGRLRDRVKDYQGDGIIIHDNRLICSHDGTCIFELPEVFHAREWPWINPTAASVEEIIEVIEKCPSGALSYTINGKLHKDFGERPSSIKLAIRGPIDVRGGITLEDEDGSVPECKEHYALCRCGRSKNKPFCDGGHMHR